MAHRDEKKYKIYSCNELFSAAPGGSAQRGFPPAENIICANFTFIGVRALKQRTYMNNDSVLMRFVQLTHGVL